MPSGTVDKLQVVYAITGGVPPAQPQSRPQFGGQHVYPQNGVVPPSAPPEVSTGAFGAGRMPQGAPGYGAPPSSGMGPRPPTGMQPQGPPMQMQPRGPPTSQMQHRGPPAQGPPSLQMQPRGPPGMMPPGGQPQGSVGMRPPATFAPASAGQGVMPRPSGPPTTFSGQQQPGYSAAPGSFQQPSGAGSFGMGADTMSAALDAFETLTLGPGGPSMPGPPGSAPVQQSPVNAASFPRPAGTAEQYVAAVGPPESKHPANCNAEFVRFSTHAVPNSQALKSRWHLPFGAIVHPMAETGGDVPVANAGHTAIVRCKRCRTYMNPFMIWMDGGRRFSCNVCQMVNECPVDYFCALDGSGKRMDVEQRPELSQGSVEYVAPAEYMVRAPMPPTFVFAIDVSFAAASSGMIAAACKSIKSVLNKLPGDDRTRVALVTFDKSVHFYNMRPGLSAPQMMVIGEIEDPFVPLPDELLVNLSESRELLEKLLDSIPDSFAHTQIVDSAMGPALQAAFLVMSHVGGKLMLFQAAAPSAGIGRIKARDNPALYGTDREYTLRCPDDPFYKRFSAEASRFQVCVDVFACGSAYQDLPSIGALPKYTGGQCYYYPGFSKDKDGNKLMAELERNITRETAWEAVMRIRSSKGLRISSFYGHFFVRSTDLLALPACDADKTFAVEITHEETVLTGQTAYLQAALLYTSSQGERRIRVHTMAIPIVSELIEMYKASDAGCITALQAKIQVERSYSAKLDAVRSYAQQTLSSALKEYRMLHMRGTAAPSPGAMVLPEKLKSLPVLVLGLLKCAAFRGTGRDVNTDERAAVCHQITTGSTNDLVKLVYPSCYRVDDEQGPWGSTAQSGDVILPSSTPAGLEYFDPTGVYLIDTGRVMVLWIGTSTPQSFYTTVFGPDALTNDRTGNALVLEPPRSGSKLSTRICAVVAQLRKHKELQQQVHVVRQGTPLEAHVMPYFVEDRMGSSGLPSYLDWMSLVQKDLMAK